MPHCIGFRSIAFASLLWAGTSMADEEVDRIARELHARWQTVSAYSARMRVTMDVTQSGIRVGTELSGPMVLERLPDDRVRFHSEVAGEVRGGPFNLLRFPITAVSVSDGEFVYSESRFRNTVTVTKDYAASAVDAAPGGGSERLLTFEEQYDLRLQSTGTLNGRRVYEIEGKPKAALRERNPQVRRLLMYFDQETGIQLRLALLDAADKPLTEVTFSDVRLNPDYDPAMFDYRIPAGAKVVDKTAEKDD